MRVAQTDTDVLPPTGARPAGWEPFALAGALTAYNVALNHVPFPAWSYVPANLALTAGVTYLARRRWGIDHEALGLTGSGIRPGLEAGGLFGTGVALVLAVAPRVTAAAPLLRDRRASGVTGRALAYQVLVRIPLGTAVPEETLFRGVLLEAFRRTTTARRAVLASSAAFGAWHIGPALVLLQKNRIELSRAATATVVAGVVAATTAAGVGFCLLRRWGRGLLAPVLAHAATGGLSLRAAARFQS
jgi:membrane protease YdiL (CAAX protease family)